MVRLALIHGAALGGDLASVQNRLTGGQIVAVVDDDVPRANSMAESIDATLAVDSVDQLLQENHDAFDGACLMQSNAGIARQIIQAGKHLLVQSPIAPSTGEADQLISACNDQVCLMVGQDARFDPSIQVVRQSIDAGQIGEPGLLRIHHWDGTSSPRCDTLERIIREIDLANWMFGHLPNYVYTIGRRESNGRPEYIQVHLGYGEGMALIDYATLPTGNADYYSLSVIGSTGAAYKDDHHNMQLLYRGDHPTAIKTDIGQANVLAQLQEFIDSINERRDPASTAKDGRAAIQVAEATIESMQTGQVVTL